MLKIFKHEGNGHWIGSCVIVSAPSFLLASNLIRRYLDMVGLHDELLDIHEVEYATTQSSLIHINDGDY